MQNLISKLFDIPKFSQPVSLIFYEKEENIMQYETNSTIVFDSVSNEKYGCYQAMIKPSSSTYFFDVSI